VDYKMPCSAALPSLKEIWIAVSQLTKYPNCQVTESFYYMLSQLVFNL